MIGVESLKRENRDLQKSTGSADCMGFHYAVAAFCRLYMVTFAVSRRAIIRDWPVFMAMENAA